MEDNKVTIAKAIADACSCLSETQCDDKAAIVETGAALEQLLLSLPDEIPVLQRALQVCLEALQGLYEESVGNPQAVFSAIIQVLSCTQQLLEENCSEDRLSDELQALQNVLNDECQEDSDSPARLEGVELAADSLEDITALLLQANPTDENDLVRISVTLRRISSETSLPSDAKKLALEAADKLELALKEKNVSEDLLAELAEALASTSETTEECITAATEPSEIRNNEPQQTDAQTEQNDSETSSQVSLLPDDFDASLVADFITECGEYIEEAEAALLALESDPTDSEAVNKVFRAFHTIKGTSAFLGLSAISDLAHKAESLLSRVRDGEIQYGGGYADLTLRSADMVKELLKLVQSALAGESVQLPDGYEELCRLLSNPEAAGISSEAVETVAPPRVGDLLVAEGAATREDIEVVAAEKGPRPIGEELVRRQVVSAADVAKAIRTQKQLSADTQGKDAFIRVRTDRLDRLIDTIGEIVIAHSMVAQDETVVSGRHHELAKKVTHMGKIVRDLQQLSMSMRMVPLKSTFQKMARMVRDLAHKTGKLVDFVTEGEDTEIDRYMVDLINDPLVHMVRNAVDHGIEPPEVREQNGKPRKGLVRLAAYHSSGNIVIELQDDGKGLNRAKIVEKAIEKGLISSDKGLSDNDVYSLIFQPGFSTAEKVTDVSGRGVGLDVVKRNIEAMRGRIEISSEPGKGTTFVVRMPLTMAITEGMLVKVGSEQFIMPIVNIRMSFRPQAEAITTLADEAEMVLVHGKPIPMYRLYELFEIPNAVEDPTQGLLIVVDDGEAGYALLVDEIVGQQSVVAKSLGYSISRTKGISGGAILGNGRVGLILDPAEIAVAARERLAKKCDSKTLQKLAA
jgi:two-component system chemotaxis sensor kinase CheA